MKNLIIALVSLSASSEVFSMPLEHFFNFDVGGVYIYQGDVGGLTLSDVPLPTGAFSPTPALPLPPAYFLTFHLDGIGEPGVFGLTPADEAFYGAIGFYSPLAANLDSASVGVQSFSVTVGNTTWDYQNLLGSIAYVSTDQSGLLTKINTLTASNPSSMFSIIDASNVSWYAVDQLSGDGTCGFWPTGTISGYCAYGGPEAVNIVSAAAVPEPSSHALLLIGLGAALIGRHKKTLS